jgi:hypothetical protein
MDDTYAEVGTEVIIWKPLITSKAHYKGHRGVIVTCHRISGSWACAISGVRGWLWFPEELILATDEPLLRPEQKRTIY